MGDQDWKTMAEMRRDAEAEHRHWCEERERQTTADHREWIQGITEKDRAIQRNILTELRAIRALLKERS